MRAPRRRDRAANSEVIQFLGPLPSGNFLAGRAGHSMKFDPLRQTTSIVMHTVGGGIDLADARYKDANSHVSAHYGVALDGSVVQWVSESDTAYHADNLSVDLTSIGIQHEDDGSDGPRTDHLYLASSQLVRQLCLRYGVPISTHYIVRHSTIAGGSITCPGGLDVDRIVAMASGASAEAVTTQPELGPPTEPATTPSVPAEEVSAVASSPSMTSL